MHERRPRARSTPAEREPDAFEAFQASVLFCDRCRVAQPVREHRLLYLPDGELWEYLCEVCGASLGTRRTTSGSGALMR